MERALRLRRAWLLLFLIAATACGPYTRFSPAPADGVFSGLQSRPAPAAIPSPIAGYVRGRAASFEADHAMQVATWLSEEIGTRPAGSTSEKGAAEGLARQLNGLGYQTAVQSFPIRQFVDRGSSVRVTGDAMEDATMSVNAMVNSASGEALGRLVPVGRARPQDLAGVPLHGAVALIERGDITFADKVNNVAAAGATGALIYNNEPGVFRGLIPDPSHIPVVSIDDTEGQRLLQNAGSRPITVELKVDTVIVEGHSQNVIAVLPGLDQRSIVLGAHYDSVPQGPGANDNASGVGTVMELARVLASDPPSLTVKVALFGAEEIGLVGSRRYVESLDAEEKDRIMAMLNFDMVGVGDAPSVGGSSDLTDMAVDIAVGGGLQLAPMTGQAASGSDHDSFISAGVPALFFHRLDDPRYHTPEDTAEFVEPSHMTQAGELALEIIDRLDAR